MDPKFLSTEKRMRFPCTFETDSQLPLRLDVVGCRLESLEDGAKGR